MSPKTSRETSSTMLALGESCCTGCCVRRRVLQGLALAMLAPLGWLFLRSMTVDGFQVLAELQRSWVLYLYMSIGAALSMIVFGVVVGLRERNLEQLNARLHYLSYTDGLTDLRNARYFWQSFEDAIARSVRDRQPVSLVLFDLDHFKKINDTHGHAVGDRVLEGIGQALADEVRAGEVAARVGGEEFALLMPGAGVEDAERAAQRIRRALAARRFEGKGGVFGVTVSGGVASSRLGIARKPQDLFDRADMALYDAKHHGRDCIRVEVARDLAPDLAPDLARKDGRDGSPVDRGHTPLSSHELDFAGQSASGEWSL